MNECCNPECEGVSKMIRCGNCRRHKIYLCAAGCNTEVSRHFKVYCGDCAKFSYNNWQQVNQVLYREKNREKIRENQRKIRVRKRLENGNLL